MTGRREVRVRRILVCTSCGARGRTVGRLWVIDHKDTRCGDAVWVYLTGDNDNDAPGPGAAA